MDLLLEKWQLVVLVAVYLALTVTLAARSRNGLLVCCASFLTITLIIWWQQWPFYGGHGYMHYSFVYELLDRGAPPNNTVFAESPLMYGYAFHFVVATFMRVFSLAPPYWFLFMNLITLCCFAVVVDKITCYMTTDLSSRVYALFLSVVGCGLLASPPISLGLQSFGLTIHRQFDPLSKFVGVNTTHLGLMFFVIGVLGTVQVLNQQHPKKSTYILICLGLLGCGIFYPIIWLVLVALLVLAIGLLIASKDGAAKRNALIIIGLLVSGAAVLYPWFWSIYSGRETTSKMAVLVGSTFVRNMPLAACLLIIPISIVLFNRHYFHQLLVTSRPTVVFLSLATLMCAGMYVSITVPLGAESKFMLCGQVLLGPIIGPFIGRIASARRAASFLLVFLLALPAAYKVAPVMVFKRALSDQTYLDGVVTKHRAPEQEDLYSWIREESPADSVFIDSQGSIPLLGRRSLLVVQGTGGRDGWGIRSPVLLTTVLGVDSNLVDRRQKLVDAVLIGDYEQLSLADELDDALSAIAPRDLLVVVRDATRAADLQKLQQFTQVWSNSIATVLRVNRPIEGLEGESRIEQVSTGEIENPGL